FLAGLLALAGVLGVGEGHLLHRKALRVKSADFAKSGSLFQSFLRLCLKSQETEMWPWNSLGSVQSATIYGKEFCDGKAL
ncbi:hypothetical protein I5I77_05295, partial [Pseudomonas aeruginosa]|nr:hypothetical protein [Pseudomonas aeruginosa]